MPYKANADLPDGVKKALPAAAQAIWRTAFNAGLTRFDADEGRAARYAWGAVGRAGWTKSGDRWVKEGDADDAVTEARKTEDGHAYPASAYLHRPDPDDPGGWKLRVWEDPEQKVTVRQLGRAAAALGPGFRGRTVTLSSDDRAAATRRLRALYRAQGVDELPPVLREAAGAAALRRLRAMQAPVYEALDAAGGDLRDLADELQEAYWGGEYIAAIADGALSYEAVITAVQRALNEHHRARHYAPGQTCPSDCRGPGVKATFAGAAVYEQEGKLWQCGYELAGTDARVDVEHQVEVTATFEPAPSTVAQEARWDAARDLEETVGAALREARVDRREGVLYHTVLITRESANGPHGRTYTDDALRKIAQLAEGLVAYANHVPDPANAFKPRDVREIIGRHRNVLFEAGAGKVRSDFHVLPGHRDWVFDLAESMPDQVGNSLVSRAVVRVDQRTGREVIEDVQALRSADLVSDPAATRGLFEHRAPGGGSQPPPGGGDGIMAAKLSEVMEFLKSGTAEDVRSVTEYLIAQARAQLEEQTVKPLREEVTQLKAKVAAAEAKVAEQVPIIAEQKAKLDTHVAEKATREKANRLATVIAESDLGKRHGKNAAAVTDEWRGSLMELAEDRWAGLIADRVKALDGAAGAGQAPKDSGKSADAGQEGQLGPQHTRKLLRAV